MRLSFIAIPLLLSINVAEAHIYCKSRVLVSHELAVGKTAYRDACEQGDYKAGRNLYVVQTASYNPPVYRKRLQAKVKARRPLEQMVYVNPPAHKIFNHPARGMKHARFDETAVDVTIGTPRIYQQLGPTLFYGPHLYSIKDRDARSDWQVK